MVPVKWCVTRILGVLTKEQRKRSCWCYLELFYFFMMWESLSEFCPHRRRYKGTEGVPPYFLNWLVFRMWLGFSLTADTADVLYCFDVLSPVWFCPSVDLKWAKPLWFHASFCFSITTTCIRHNHHSDLQTCNCWQLLISNCVNYFEVQKKIYRRVCIW